MSILSNNTTKIGLITFFSSLYFYLPILTIYYQTKGLNFVQINSLWGFLIGAIFLAVILFSLNYGVMSLQDPLFADYYNIHIVSEIRATTLSAISMVSGIYIVIIGLIIGYIADISVLYAFLFIGILILIPSIVFRISEEHVRHKRTN